jgi:hypothetical protein
MSPSKSTKSKKSSSVKSSKSKKTTTTKSTGSAKTKKTTVVKATAVKPKISAKKSKAVPSKTPKKSSEKRLVEDSPYDKALRSKIDKAADKGGKKRNYSEIDKDVLTVITENRTILIEEIQKALHLTEDETKKAVKRLEAKNKVKSDRVMEVGKWMTRVNLVDNYGMDSQAPKKIIAELVWNTQGDLPCFLCPQTRKCGQGQENLNPEKCVDLTEWIDARMFNKEYVCKFKNQVNEGK